MSTETTSHRLAGFRAELIQACASAERVESMARDCARLMERTFDLDPVGIWIYRPALAVVRLVGEGPACGAAELPCPEHDLSLTAEQIALGTPGGFAFPMLAQERPIGILTASSRTGIAPDVRDVLAASAEVLAREIEGKRAMMVVRLLCEQSADGYLVLDERRVAFCNLAAARMLRFDAVSQVIGLRLEDLSAPRQPDGREADAKLAKMLEEAAGNGSHRFGWTLRRRDGGEVAIQCSVSRIVGDFPGAFLMVWHDLTERTEIEADLRSAKESAELADRLKGELLAEMSVQVRTPLRGLLGVVDLLLASPLTARQKEYARIIRSFGGALVGKMNESLDSARIETKRESVVFDLADSIEDLLDLLSAKAAAKRLRLVLVYSPETSRRTCGDPARIQQILLALMDHAVVCATAGFIEIQVSRRQRDSLRIQVEWSGSSEAQMPPVCRRLIEEMGGRCGAGDFDRRGVVWLELPLRDEVENPVLLQMNGPVLVALAPGPEARCISAWLERWGVPFVFDARELGTKSPACAIADGHVPCEVSEAVPRFSLQCPGSEGGATAGTALQCPIRSGRLRGILRSLGANAELGPPAENDSLMDGDEFLSRFGHDSGLAGEMIDVLSAQLPELAAVAGSAVLNCNSAQLGAAGQQLRTAAATMCSPALIGVARGLEECAQTRDWTRARRLEGHLSTVLGRLVEELLGVRPRREVLPYAKAGPSEARVLVVDDDAVSRLLARRSIERCGYQITSAESVAQARQFFKSDAVDCVVTDYRMPNETGLDLLRWLRNEDPTLAVIMVTADADEELLEASLRDGVSDFLSKPVEPAGLQRSVSRAVATTRQQRAWRASQSALRRVSETHSLLLGPAVSSSRLLLELCRVPKHEAGGDDLARYDLDRDRSLVILTDVSGHDIGAAFCSAYFHGMVRGMLESRSTLQAVFDKFNRHLLEWRDNPLSIAASGILFDSARMEVEVMSAGAPSPVYVDAGGRAYTLASEGSYPLGWFEGSEAEVHRSGYEQGTHFLLWSDGLEELASRLNVSACCLPCLLFEAERAGFRPKWLGDAQDDVMAACVRPQGNRTRSCDECPRLVVLEEYTRDDLRHIDALQQTWENSIRMAVPKITDGSLHDLLLCSREAVLNAVQHGLCNGGKAGYQLSYVPPQRRFCIRVEDPGPGHQFDVKTHRLKAETGLVDRCRGLLLIHDLAGAVWSERRGASLRIDMETR